MARGIALFMVRGIAVRVKRAVGFRKGKRTVEDTLPFSHLRLTNVRQETGVGGANKREVIARLLKAQFAVYGEADLGGVGILLTVIFPPADGTQPHRVRRLQRLVSTTGTAETGHGTVRGLTLGILRLHGLIDGESLCRITPGVLEVPLWCWIRDISAKNPDEQNFIAIVPSKD